VPDCKDVECDYHGITHLDWDKVVLFGKGGLEGASYQFQGIASLIFCYVNHQLLFPLIHDLKNPTKKRMDKIFFRVHFTEIVSYMLVGLAGYLLLVEHVDKRDINAIVIASIVTTTMSIGKVLLVLSIFFSIPLNTYPTREVLFESFQLERNNKNHILLSLGISFSGTIIGIFFQNVSSYFGILGGTAGVMMAGGFPALCYYKLKGLRTNNQKMLIVFTVIVSVCAAIGAILSVFDPS
jgi:amino acid permease